jgi:glycosyltransferase involved in cell wall biosynthesis
MAHERPVLLSLVVRSLREQTMNLDAEIIVVDDSVVPYDAGAFSDIRVVRVTPGAPLGQKLNIGASVSRADLLVKIDDDDWYGPRFLRLMADGIVDHDVAFVQPFNIVDTRTLNVHRADAGRCSGSGITFRRAVWIRSPFRSERCQVDAWFLLDALENGFRCTPVDVDDEFLYLRHDHDHLWNELPDGQPFDDYLSQRAETGRCPDSLLPSWMVNGLRGR